MLPEAADEAGSTPDAMREVRHLAGVEVEASPDDGAVIKRPKVHIEPSNVFYSYLYDGQPETCNLN